MPQGLRVEIKLRDPNFEREVKYAGLYDRLPLHSAQVLSKIQSKSNAGIRWFYGGFDWQHLVIVQDANGRSLVIDHDHEASLAGDLKVRAKQADPQAILNTVKLVFPESSRSVPTAPARQQEERERPKSRRNGAGRRRRVPPPSNIPSSIVGGGTVTPKPPKEAPTDPPRKKKKRNAAPIGHVPEIIKPVNPATKDGTDQQPPSGPSLKKMSGFDMDDSF